MRHVVNHAELCQLLEVPSFVAETTTGDTLVVTSDFVDFSNTGERDFALLLPHVAPSLFTATGCALRSLRGYALRRRTRAKIVAA